ncbi:MFS transporter [Blastococcus saxobsidens]|uniref:MFS transporter n=1 Tax=Blastococcus saxobsidens TaxID=138336 RepID=A0A6L9W4R9_9ACTN|nr:MFS transporter [Blastococcus saxobsidens]NEK87053.1 MFS transporter [Blastococcus saxobsidens]
MKDTTSRLTRAERLDRLPFTREHGRLVVGSGMGWALDAMDVGLISFVMTALVAQWGLSNGEVSLIGSIGFVGMALGATLGGLLADRYGRRQVFALTLLVFGVATGAAALSWSVGALLVFRFLIGLGLGAELPVASTLVSEFAPARVRGRVVVLLEAFWAVGWTLAALIGYFVVPSSDDGWRWALAIGAVPALYAVVVRRGLPESVRFLELRGRTEEAEATVRRFERSADVEPVPSPPPAPPARPARVGALWAAGTGSRTAALWVVWFSINFAYYGAFIWLPTLLFNDGFSLVKSFQYTLIITLAQLPGYAVAAYLIEKWGRRPTLATFLVGSAVGAGMFAAAEADTAILVTGMVLSFFNLGAWGALYAVTPEIYPTALRATGAGAAAGFGRIASIIAPLCVPLLVDTGGTGLVFGVFAAFFLLAAVAALGLPELRGQALDQGVAHGPTSAPRAR